MLTNKSSFSNMEETCVIKMLKSGGGRGREYWEREYLKKKKKKNIYTYVEIF